jgi:NADH-quinone oxidoreductase subunit L
MELFILSPILFPLLGLLINATVGKRLGEKAVGWIASLAVIASFVMSLMMFMQVNAMPAAEGGEHSAGLHATIAPWITAGALNVSWGFTVDSLSVTLMLIITGIGALIHIYSIGYMHGDERFPRFFVYLNLFVSSMLVLVMADNFLVMFVGWELVGLCSYLLIGFWFKNVKNAEAGRKAFVANRIGDVGFILGIFLIFVTFGTLSFSEVFAKVEGADVAVITVITLLLFIGATGKSAQIPLFVWLPDAMAGPTPVSALIHAATMVTAGIYMMTRAHPMFEIAAATQTIVALIGALTALVAGFAALTQNDIKKVLAYSTVSQLGFMVAAAGMGAYVAAMFHLITHAFFKALLFLGAGSVIHGMEHHAKHSHASAGDAHHGTDPQDMRNMGGLARKMPITFITFLIGALALAGVPPLSGFWSKDEVMLDALVKGQSVVLLLLTVSAFMTAFYAGRQLIMVFLGKPRTEDAQHASESGILMTAPLILLAIGSAVVGAINVPGSMALKGSLTTVLGKEEAPAFNAAVAVFYTLLALAGLAGAWLMYRRAYTAPDSPEPLSRFGGLYRLSFNKWYVDEIYNAIIIKPFYAISTVCAQVLDVGVIDGIVNGVGRLTRNIAGSLRGIQTGYVRNYGLVMLMGVVVVVAYFILNAR